MMIAANRMKTFGVSFARPPAALDDCGSDRCYVGRCFFGLCSNGDGAGHGAIAGALKASRYWAIPRCQYGPSVVTGNLGLSPGRRWPAFLQALWWEGQSMQRMPSRRRLGPIQALPMLTWPARLALRSYRDDLGGLTSPPVSIAFLLRGLTGTLTLKRRHAAAVWVFKIGSTLTTASNSSVVLVAASHATCFGRWAAPPLWVRHQLHRQHSG